MAKTKISEFDIDPANNTDINSINIAEGCAPSGINNAIRQLMSDLKEFQTGAGGDSITATGVYSDTIGEKTSAAGVTVDGVLIKDNAVTASGGFSGALNGAVGGTTPAAGAFTTLSASGAFSANGGATLGDASGDALTINSSAVSIPNGLTFNSGAVTLSSNPTFSAGTANGVLYLNGSKVATSGSALTFNGSDFGVSASVATATLASSGAYSAISFTNSGGASANGLILTNSSAIMQRRAATHTWTNVDATTEYMRITSTGNVGIGTSSPSYKLDVNGIINSNNAIRGTQLLVANTYGISLSDDIASGFLAYNYNSGRTNAASHRFYNGITTEVMRLDSSGNLGLGVTPSAWKSTYKALQIGNTASIVNAEGYTFFVENAYFNSADTPIYLKTLPASYYRQESGTHKWYNAPSGTAGNTITFTQAMTLDASGNLSVGTTSNPSGYRLKVNGITQIEGANTVLNLGQLSSTATYIQSLTTSSAAADLVFLNSAERMRIDSSGNLLVGTTTLAGNGFTMYPNGSGGGIYTVYNRPATSSTTTALDFKDGGTTKGSISYTNTATSFNTSSDYRLKENVAPMTGALAKNALLKPCTYTWKADGSAGEGFIAHELAEVMPNAVTGEKDAVNEDGSIKPQGIDTSFLVGHLVACIQELKAEVDSLKAQLNK